MPAPSVRYAANQFGDPGVSGFNEQIGLLAINNSGAYMAHGDVVVWDLTTTNPPATTTVTVSGAQTLTQASFTLTCGSSTAAFNASGAILVMASAVTGGPAVPMYVSYTGITGSTFTGCQAAIASITNGAASGAQVTQSPVQPLASGTAGVPAYAPAVGLVGTTGDAGRYVTYANGGIGTGLSGAYGGALAGIVSVTGDAGTTVGGAWSGGATSPPNGWNVTAAPPVIAPGEQVFVVTQGIARVQVGASTITAAQDLYADVIPRQAITGTNFGRATMAAGTITVTNPLVRSAASGQQIFLTPAVTGGTPGTVVIGTRTAGTSFVINSSNGADTSQVDWYIYPPSGNLLGMALEANANKDVNNTIRAAIKLG